MVYRKTRHSIYIRRVISFEQSDFETVVRVARERSLGGKGFSAAVRQIVREWRTLQERGEACQTTRMP